MKKKQVVVTGGTGLVGRAVVGALVESGWSPVVLTRSPERREQPGVAFAAWDGRTAGALIPLFEQADAVVHLAGETVAQRWSPRAKEAILKSRTEGGAAVREAVEALPAGRRPVLVAASAIGCYADGPGWQDELTPVAERGFLADVVRAWEAVLHGVETRHVTFRIGVVLSRKGGALGRLEPLFRWGLGSAVGTGNQWQSWIHVTDLAHLIVHALGEEAMEGIYNAVAPEPVTNRELSRDLARAMRKPFLAPAPPAWVLRAVLGEMAAIVLESQRIRSCRLASTGFRFQFPKLERALNDLYAA